MRIWKWDVAITDRQSLDMPAGAKVLAVQKQGDIARLWALCDENAPLTARTFAIYGTGNPTPQDPGEYVATFQAYDGALVWHLFEIQAGRVA